MRLSHSEIKIIKETILKYISDAKLTLFGSRVDDNRRGGDIDILVTTNINIELTDKLNILSEFEINGIERKVDLIIKTTKSQIYRYIK